MMGFDPAGWRMDDTVHPFAIRIGRGDVRITTRWDESYFPAALYGAMHECGHGLYEAGIPAAFARSPLGSGESLGMHESQSRLWENMVGRGRPFCAVLAPRVAAHFGALSDLDADTLYRAVNRVKPSFIRVESDEVTYALHIVLRFELEQQLIEGTPGRGRSARGLERPLRGVLWHRGHRRRRRRAPGRALVGWADRLLPHLCAWAT